METRDSREGYNKDATAVSMISAISDGFNVLQEDEARGYASDAQNSQHAQVQLPPGYQNVWKDVSHMNYLINNNGGMQFGMQGWHNEFDKKDINSSMFRVDNGTTNNSGQQGTMLGIKTEEGVTLPSNNFTKIKTEFSEGLKEQTLYQQQWGRQFDNNFNNVMNNGNNIKPQNADNHSTPSNTFTSQGSSSNSIEQKDLSQQIVVKSENSSISSFPQCQENYSDPKLESFSSTFGSKQVNSNHCNENGNQKGNNWLGNNGDTKMNASGDSYTMQRDIYLRDSYSVIPQNSASPVSAIKRERDFGNGKSDCYQPVAKFPRNDTDARLIENGVTPPPSGGQKMISLQPVKLEPTLLSIPGDHCMNINQQYGNSYGNKLGSYGGNQGEGFGHTVEEPDRNCIGKSVSSSLLSLQDFAYGWTPGTEAYTAMVGYRATINHPSLSMELNNAAAMNSFGDNTHVTQEMANKNYDTSYSKPSNGGQNEPLCSSDNYTTLCNLDQSTCSSFQSNDGFDSSSYSVGNSIKTEDMDDSFGKSFGNAETEEYHQDENGEEEGSQSLSCRCGICQDTFDTSISLRAHIRMHTESIALQCEICNKKFKNKVELRTHCENHDEEKLLTCDICDKTFEKKRCLKTHLRTHSDEKKKLHKCEVCGRQYGTLQGYLLHKDTHGIDEPHECSTCGKVFGHADLLSFHMKTHTDIYTFMCHVCDKKFGNNRDLQKHLSKHTGLLPFQCSICNEAFSDDYALQMHISEHTGEHFHICDVCGKAYKDIPAMQEHKKTHSEEKPFICEICCKGFKSKTNLHEHYRIHSGEKPFECHVCGKRFRQSSILRNHVRIHTGETPWECAECGKKFSFKGNYTRHLWSHTEEKERTCRVCGKIFTDMIGLKQHLERHSRQLNQKPKSFKCNICDTEFDRSRTLQMHMKVHTGDCPFTCDICEKTFVSKSDLSKHVKLHDDEKSFRCDVCDKSYVDNGRLRRHMKIHMGLKPFKCDVCGSSFTEKYHLTKHQKTHQKDTSEK